MNGNATTEKPVLAESYKSYPIRGLDCADCAGRLEREILKDDELRESAINFAAARIRIPESKISRVQEIIDQVEPGVVIETDKKAEPAPRRSAWNLRIVRIAASLLLMGIGIGFRPALHDSPFNWAEYLVFLGAYLLVGWPVLHTAGKNLRRGLVFDENFLMSLATIGAIAIHQLPEAVGVMLFYAVGEYFQDRAVDSSRRSVTALLKARPDQANLKKGDEVLSIPPSEVPVGARILIRPGERVPLDGKILDGDAAMDTSALTGESVPRRAESGDEVLAGMVCLDGVLTVEVEKPEAESSISRILTLVEEAAGRKAPTEQFITTFSRYYTPAVVVIALAIALVPPLVVQGALFSDWLYRALTLLVVSCPCALVVSIPLGYFGGLGGASRKGILIKGANYLEALTAIDTIALDKTGTVTRGRFEVTAARPAPGIEKHELLEIAAAAEAHSSHPIAAAIRSAAGGEITDGVSEYREIAGRGISAQYRGEKILVGNERLLSENDIFPPAGGELSGDETRVFVAAGENGTAQWLGTILIADSIKPGVSAMLRELKHLGTRRVVMVSGDISSTVRSVAEKTGFDAWHAELLPEEKVAAVEELEKESGGRMLFAGDGMNDAPVLARADVGVAMGGLGSDAAIEAADVVIMDDDPGRIVTAIQIARRTRRIVYENIVLALSIKLCVIALGIFGAATMWEAVVADVGVALLAILNATRALKVKE